MPLQVNFSTKHVCVQFKPANGIKRMKNSSVRPLYPTHFDIFIDNSFDQNLFFRTDVYFIPKHRFFLYQTHM